MVRPWHVIPKPNKDHKAAKGWRPINLINCIGKLAEKVVAVISGGVPHLDGTNLGKDGDKGERGHRPGREIAIICGRYVRGHYRQGGRQWRQHAEGGGRGEEDHVGGCQLPLETDKEEILHLRTSRKKKNGDRRYVKWGGRNGGCAQGVEESI